MKNSQKGSANGLLIIVIVILAAAVIYFAFIKKTVVQIEQVPVPAEPTVQNTQPVSSTIPTTASQTISTASGTKTYTNTQYSFQFNYTPGITVSDDEDAPSGVPGRMQLQIENTHGAGYIDLYAYAPQSGGNTCTQDYGTQGYTNVTINGLNFTKGDITDNYESMNNTNPPKATEYCTIGSNGDKYELDQVDGVPGTDSPILDIINSFTLLK